MKTIIFKLIVSIILLITITLCLYSIPAINKRVNFWMYTNTFSCRQMQTGHLQWCTDRIEKLRKELDI